MSSLKRLINPPIQALLWGSGLALLALGAWSIVSLKMLDERGGKQADISVQIPDSSMLDTPDLNSYPQMVSAPLFWESRKAVEPEKEVVAEIVEPVDTTLPQGRLIGIIDTGGSLFAIMENAAGGSVQLRQGDFWGAWKVAGIDPDRVLLELGDQHQDIPLVGDFAAPKENPQVSQERAMQQQQAAQQRAAAARQAQQQAVLPAVSPSQQNAPPAPPGNAPQTAGLPFPADTQKQPPPLSVKDALEARQRLMASRWGALTGDQNNNQPATGQ